MTDRAERWLIDMVFDTRYRDTLKMPERFWDRLRQAWRDLGSGNETLELHAICLLRNRHDLDWTQKRCVACRDCKRHRPKVEPVIKGVIV